MKWLFGLITYSPSAESAPYCVHLRCQAMFCLILLCITQILILGPIILKCNYLRDYKVKLRSLILQWSSHSQFATHLGAGIPFCCPKLLFGSRQSEKFSKKLPPSSSERINITKDGARWVAAVDLDFWLGWLTDCSVNCPPTYEFPCFWGISCKLEMTWRVSLFLFQVCSEGWAPRILQLVWPLSAKQLFGPLVGLYLTHPTSLIPLPPMMVVKG